MFGPLKFFLAFLIHSKSTFIKRTLIGAPSIPKKKLHHQKHSQAPQHHYFGTAVNDDVGLHNRQTIELCDTIPNNEGKIEVGNSLPVVISNLVTGSPTHLLIVNKMVFQIKKLTLQSCYKIVKSKHLLSDKLGALGRIASSAKFLVDIPYVGDTITCIKVEAKEAQYVAGNCQILDYDYAQTASSQLQTTEPPVLQDMEGHMYSLIQKHLLGTSSTATFVSIAKGVVSKKLEDNDVRKDVKDRLLPKLENRMWCLDEKLRASIEAVKTKVVQLENQAAGIVAPQNPMAQLIANAQNQQPGVADEMKDMFGA